jgi:cytochrome c553
MMISMSKQRITCVLLLLAASSALAVDFVTDIEPVFADRCLECHGPDKQKSQFRLDRLANLLSGGNTGEPAVMPGSPESSFLLKLIKHEESEMEMPPKGDPLTVAQIALIGQWIQEGAKTPVSYGPATEKVILAHWSFQPVKRSATATSIDGFVDNTLKAKGLKRSAEANRRSLIRRLYLVMLGMPPTPQEVDAFEANRKPDAWARLVDSVLAKPQYGERWASHWLDLVRFGETHGFEMNRERPNAWRFRDWVIESFNRDMPYDAFVRAQLAGDATGVPIGTGFLVAGPVDQVKGQDPKLRLTQRMNELDDMINATGTAFLGLTTGCARCHNHKFDPISQKDYYAMQAIFSGVKHGNKALPLSVETKAEVGRLNGQVKTLTAKLAKFLPGAAAAQPGKPPMRAAVSSKLNVERFAPSKVRFVRFTIEATNGGEPCIDELEIYSGTQNVALASLGAKPSSGGDFVHPLHKLEHINDGEYGNAKSWIAAKQKGWVQIELRELSTVDRIEWARDRNGKYSDRLATRYRIEAAEKAGAWRVVASSVGRSVKRPGKKPAPEYRFEGHPDAKQGKQWLSQVTAAKARKYRLESSKLAYTGTFAQPGPTHRLYRGEPDAKRERVGPGAISAFVALGLPLDAPERQRRVALADWVGSADNPLTARVMVNRLWQFHFGTGIVDTPSDFGANGTPPSHPLLLDWLAAELMANSWSLKHLHRLILMSATWRQDSQPDMKAMRVDAASRLVWRFPTRRLEAEAIRDSILVASGVLDATPGGPGFSAFRVDKENVRHYHAKESYGPEDWRRMIYMTKVRQEQDSVFGVFDCPDASQAVAKRSRSTTPLQALNLLNSTFILQQADLLAKRLQREGKADLARVQRAWQLCFQRPPNDAEVADSVTFIAEQGMVQFCRAMLNSNEFVFIP